MDKEKFEQLLNIEFNENKISKGGRGMDFYSVEESYGYFMCLEGTFSADELEAFVWWLREKEKRCPLN